MSIYDALDANAMETISVQMPDELEAELERYVDEEHLDQRSAVRKLLTEGLEN